jgi:GntR family transcriptional repressor for pyruvate dehydrogenase complex
MPRRGNLTELVIRELSSRMDAGTYSSGDKLPSEQELCRELGVSRTVVREAVASLRLGGRLISRQGIGVFVTDQGQKRINFEVSPADTIRPALQILELRIGVEAEAVALAATRRTPAALAGITLAFDRFNALDGSDIPEEVDLDFEFHMAIARATNNPHFPQFLEALGRDIIFDLGIKHAQASGQSRRTYIKKIGREHGAILSAISQGDAAGARSALRRHLEDSLVRYRRLTDA